MAEVNNTNCSRDCKHLVIELIQYVTMNTGWRSNTQEYNKLQNKYDGVEARKETGGLTRYLQLDLSMIKSKIHDADGMNADDVFIANQIQPTTSG